MIAFNASRVGISGRTSSRVERFTGEAERTLLTVTNPRCCASGMIAESRE
jgi:hypothetical protein